MLIREVMKSDPVSISPETVLADAYKIMIEKNIRHLPVIDNGKLVGVVTDRDLRLATSRLRENPFDPGEAVSGVMSRNVMTAHPNDPVEQATRTMRELKIGCLPVVEDKKLVGIVTGIDLLDALLMLTGVHQPSGRLDVRLMNRTGELAKLASLLAEKNVNIHSILSYQEENNSIRLVLRVGTMEIKKIAEEICKAGFQVVWPVHAACAE